MNLSRKIRLENIRSTFKEKNYRFFSRGDLNLNLIGVRNSDRISNRFDDLFYLIFKVDSDWQMYEWPITTDPGRHWLENPMTKTGTAILAPGQYRGAWEIGKHRGKYTALVQVKPVIVFRDNNKDRFLDTENVKTEKGLFGINIHRSSPYGPVNEVNKWSAGCQVFQNPEDFTECINICKKAAKQYGPRFTYTLINEIDLY